MSSIYIAPFTGQSSDQIFDLILPIQREEFGIAVTREDQVDLVQIPMFYQNGNGNFWVAMDKDDIIGTIALKDIGQGQVALRKMFVRADHRGKDKGIAQQLLDEVFSWSKIKQITDIFLGTTSAFLAAHRFYEKNGFQEIEKHSLPTSFPMMTVDTKFYRYNMALG